MLRADDAPLHFISASSGTVVVLRPNGSSFRASAGTPLRGDDVLQFTGDARATVVCADLSKVQLPSEPGSIAGVPCSSGTAMLLYRGELHSTLRGGENNAAIVGPAYSLAFSNRPSLQWMSAATDPRRLRTYVLLMYENDTLQGRQKLTANPSPYPRDFPSLASDRRYRFEIRQEGSAQSGPAVELQLMRGSEQRIVREQLQRVAALSLPARDAAFVRAHILTRNRAHYEALLELAGAQGASALTMRGEQLLAAGFATLALRDLENAVAATQGSGDERMQAIAHQLAAEVLVSAGNKEAALAHYRATLTLLLKLDEGDPNSVRAAIALLD